MGKFGVVSKQVSEVSVTDLKTAFPAKRDTITEATAKLINDAQNDPTFSLDGFMRTLVEYQDVMIKGSVSMKDYINAIKFCSYLEAEDFSIVDAYKRSRGMDKFVLDRLDAPTDSSKYKELTSAASRYHKSPLVRQILVQSDMPLYLMFQGARYKAVNTLVTEMETAIYAKDRITAAKEILTHVKPPEETKVELELGLSEESKSMQDSLNEQLTLIAINQKKLLSAGGTIQEVQKVSVDLIDGPIDVGGVIVAESTLPTVDDLLDTIDLTFPNYTPSEEALHFWNTMQLIKGPRFFTAGIPVLHYYFIDLVFNNVDRASLPYSEEVNAAVRLKRNKLAILCSRGLSKSTTFSCFLVIYMAMFGRLPGLQRPGIGDQVRFVVGVGASQEGGAKVMCNTLRDMIEESELLKNYFEKIRCTDAEIELVRQGTEPASDRSFMFRTKGAQGGIRGERYKGERIDVIIGDDMVKNESDSRSDTIMQSIRSTIYSDATHALRAQGGMEILIGTPFNKKDIVYSAIEGGWTPLVVPICSGINDETKASEFIGAWPEMHSYDRVKDRYLDMKEAGEGRAFQQELMLRISSEEDKLVKEGQVQWYSRKALIKNLDNYNIYITTDLTASNSLTGDFSGIMAWAVSSNGDWFMLDACVQKMSISEQYEPIFRMVREWAAKFGRNAYVGVEIDGQQQLNVHALKKQMLEYSTHFTFARQIGAAYGKEGISRRRAAGAKHEQFMRVHPLFQGHKIYFPEEIKDSPDMKEILNELNYITYEGIGSKHDDALDCISMIAAMDVRLPSMGNVTLEREHVNSRVWGSFDTDDDDESTSSTVF